MGHRVPPRILVALSRSPAISQTFVVDHIEHLQARCFALFGPGFVPLVDDRPLSGTWRRALWVVGLSLARAMKRRIARPWSAAVARFLRREGIDAVLAEFGPAGVQMMDACDMAGVPLIVHFHGRDAYSSGVLSRAGRAYGELFSRAAAIVVVSSDMRRRLLQLGAAGEKLHVIPCGVDPRAFKGGDPASAAPVFVSVGRFVPKKGALFTIAAFKLVYDVDPSARLVMVGEGPSLEACKQRVSALGLGDAVRFTGDLPRPEVAALLRSARGFVLHSITTKDGDREGTPVALLEAGATGLPSVATIHGGIPEIVSHGRTGFLVEERDVEGTAEAMLRLLRDPALARRLGEAARVKIGDGHTLDISIGRLRSVIEGSLQGENRASVPGDGA